MDPANADMTVGIYKNPEILPGTRKNSLQEELQL
jgi:hypothetical protein